MIKLRKNRRRTGRSLNLGRKFFPALESVEQRLLLAANGFLQGTAYIDLNNDQRYDSGDQPLAGATITITNNSFSTSMVTGASGSYTFTNLTPGNYQITEAPPSGYTSSSASANWSIGSSQVVNPTTINAQVIDTSQVYVNWITTGACETLGVYVQGPNIPLFSLPANVGELDGSLGTQPGLSDISAFVPAYCVDLYGDFNGSSTGFQITPSSAGLLQGNAPAIAYLLNEYQASIASDFASANASGDPIALHQARVEGAALQFAIWQLEYMAVPDPTLANFNDPIFLYTPSSYPDVIAQYDFYLNDAANAVASGFAQTVQALFLSAENPNVYQSLATAGGSLNFGNTAPQTGSISGLKFNDVTGDGVYVAGQDAGLQGVTIALYQNGGGTPIATTSTGADGTYGFGNLAPGTYSVQEVAPGGWTQTAGIGGYTVTLGPGQNVTGENFGNFQNIAISGTKYNDLTGNGFSADDSVLGGVTINLYRNGGSTPVASQATNANGQFSFTNLGPGTYFTQEVVPDGWTETGGIGGYTVNAQSGQNITGEDFANFGDPEISGYKFDDLNMNTVWDSNEPGVGGVTIALYTSTNGILTPFTINGTQLTAVTSDGTHGPLGYYSFTHLPPLPSGTTYAVREIVPSGFIQTTPNPANVAALSGTVVTNANFGNVAFVPATISGTVYVDQTDVGYLTNTDPRLSAVTITLTGTNDLGVSVTLTTMTNSSGYYSFTGLRPGTYTLTETVPSPYSPASNNVGTINGSTPTGVTVTKSPDAINGVPVTYGSTGVNFNFGNLYNSGQTVASGQTATIGFWQNKNGQALIKSFNGGSSSTALAQWLCTAFPNLYSNALSTTVNGHVSYATNTQVAAYFVTLFNAGGTKTMAQLLCTALSVYATTLSLGGAAGSQYGFVVSANGLGVNTYNVGSNGQAFGVPNNTKLTVFQILNRLNSQALNGVLFAGNANQSSLVNQANTVLNGINVQGDI